MTPPSSPQWTVDVNPPGVMPPCQVCESDRLDQLSQRMWAYLPTTLEALQVCLHCGNVLRAAPFPSESPFELPELEASEAGLWGNPRPLTRIT